MHGTQQISRPWLRSLLSLSMERTRSSKTRPNTADNHCHYHGQVLHDAMTYHTFLVDSTIDRWPVPAQTCSVPLTCSVPFTWTGQTHCHPQTCVQSSKRVAVVGSWSWCPVVAVLKGFAPFLVCTNLSCHPTFGTDIRKSLIQVLAKTSGSCNLHSRFGIQDVGDGFWMQGSS